MRKLLLILPIVLTACSGGFFDQVADNLIIEDVTSEERTFRAVAVLGVVGELAADRVTNREPETAVETLIAVRELQRAMQGLTVVGSDDPFFETVLFETDVAIVSALRNVAKHRVRSVLRGFAGGGTPSIDSILGSLEAGAKASAMRQDAIRGIEMLRSGDISLDMLTTAWRNRFDRNLKRIETLVDIQA